MKKWDEQRTWMSRTEERPESAASWLIRDEEEGSYQWALTKGVDSSQRRKRVT